jgi:hypothetical protein
MRGVSRLIAVLVGCGLMATLLACTSWTSDPDRQPAPGKTTPARSKSIRPPLTYEQNTPVGAVAGVLTTAGRGEYRSGCQPKLIVEVASRFAAAIAADPPTTRMLAGARFAAYSMSERATGRHSVAYTHPQLAGLLRARAGKHERQRLIAVLVKPEGHLEFVGLRVADDLPAGVAGRVRVTRGKAKVHCDSASIEVFNAVDEGDPGTLTMPSEPLGGWIPPELPSVAQPVITELGTA